MDNKKRQFTHEFKKEDVVHKFTAAFKISGNPNDLEQLTPMVRGVQKILGKEEFTILTDQTYYYAADSANYSSKRITIYSTSRPMPITPKKGFLS